MCNSQPRSSSNGDNSREGGDNQHWQGLYPDISEMFSNMDTSNSNDQSQVRSPGQVPPIMLLLQQLLGLPQDQQQTGAEANQDTPSAPPSTDHQDQPPPPPTQQQGPPPPQQNQFCSNCSGSRGRQDDCRQYLENMIPVIINKCRYFSTVFTRSMFSVGSILMMFCLLHAIPNTIISGILFMMICTSLGLHLPTILAANVLHCFLINMNPFFLTLFSIWAFHRTVVQKRPLFNMNYWRRNFSSHCHRH